MSGLSTLSGAPALGRRSDSGNSGVSLTGGLLPLGGKPKITNTTSDLDELLSIMDDEPSAARSRSTKPSKTDKADSKASKSKSKSRESKSKGKSKKPSSKGKGGGSGGSDEEVVVSSDELGDMDLDAFPSRSTSRPSTASGSAQADVTGVPLSTSSSALLQPTGFSLTKGTRDSATSRSSKDIFGPDSPEQKHTVGDDRALSAAVLFIRSRNSPD